MARSAKSVQSGRAFRNCSRMWASLNPCRKRRSAITSSIEELQSTLDQLNQRRKQTPLQIPAQELPAADRFTRLRTERKYFLDTIKMIAYRAETSMPSTVREKLKRSRSDER